MGLLKGKTVLFDFSRLIVIKNIIRFGRKVKVLCPNGMEQFFRLMINLLERITMNKTI
jgi:hypothetical protein